MRSHTCIRSISCWESPGAFNFSHFEHKDLSQRGNISWQPSSVLSTPPQGVLFTLLMDEVGNLMVSDVLGFWKLEVGESSTDIYWNSPVPLHLSVSSSSQGSGSLPNRWRRKSFTTQVLNTRSEVQEMCTCRRSSLQPYGVLWIFRRGSVAKMKRQMSILVYYCGFSA